MNWDPLFILFVGLCVALSFLFSGMEAGVFALSRLRIRRQARTGHRRAALLHGYLEDPENFLWSILIGNTLATFLALSMIVVALFDAMSKQPVVFFVVFLAIAFLFYALCDLLPKMLFQLFPTRLCLALAVPFRFIHLSLSPLVSLLTWFSNRLLRLTGGTSLRRHLFASRSELRMATQETAQGLTSEERGMIARVLDLQNLTVRSIAVSLPRVTGVAQQTPAKEVLKLCQEHGLTRLPVWQGEGSTRRIAGVANLRSFLYAADFDSEKPIGAYVTPALYLREDLRLEEALRRMQRSGQRLAIVLSTDHRELGVVSLQDILKVIFGEISL
ncbi:MAG: DUF21 domain-containing protein [Verrucomicrobia bacterium]|nr:DUF21 domain-containing protein [Verrucomicrobiota bacterium]